MRPAAPPAAPHLPARPPAGDKLKQLIALRTSSHYLDRLAAGLQQKAAQEAKFHRRAAAAARPAAFRCGDAGSHVQRAAVCGALGQRPPAASFWPRPPA